MYLKRLEMYGFKSFADNTIIDLENNILTVLIDLFGQETPVEVEEVTEIKFDEPAAYEISTDIPEISFIDDEDLTPTSKEDILKQATKTVGTKRTVKEKKKHIFMFLRMYIRRLHRYFEM